MPQESVSLRLNVLPVGLSADQSYRISFVGRVTGFSEANPDFEESMATIDIEPGDVVIEPTSFQDAARMALEQVRQQRHPGIGQAVLPST